MPIAESITALAPVAWPLTVLVLGLIFGPFVLGALTRTSRGKIGPLEWENDLRKAAKQSAEAAEIAKSSFSTLDELAVLMARSRITELQLVLQTPLFPGSEQQRSLLVQQIAQLEELTRRLNSSLASRP